jgi:hypothetical protein
MSYNDILGMTQSEQSILVSVMEEKISSGKSSPQEFM